MRPLLLCCALLIATTLIASVDRDPPTPSSGDVAGVIDFDDGFDSENELDDGPAPPEDHDPSPGAAWVRAARVIHEPESPDPEEDVGR